jgi:hypothetical protein
MISDFEKFTKNGAINDEGTPNDEPVSELPQTIWLHHSM